MRILFVVLLFLVTGFAQAQCSDSVVNCTGECGQFVDENNDGYCDDSILDTVSTKVSPPPVMKPVEKHPQTLAVMETTSVKPVKTIPATDRPALTQLSVAKAKVEKKAGEAIVIPSAETTATSGVKQTAYVQLRRVAAPQANQQHRRGNRYNYSFLAIVLPLAGAYFLLQYLCSKKLIARSSFLRIWNLALLATFVVSGLLGLLITAKLVYGFQLPGIKTIYTLHVDFGVAMAVISLFHVALHWKYFRNMVRS